jgi:hypothetical protein
MSLDVNPWETGALEPPPDPYEDTEPELEDPQARFDRDVAHETHRIKVRETAKRRVADERAAAAPPLDAALLGAVLARPAEPPSRVESLIPSDAGTLLIAQRKTGKTTITLNLARSLLTGETFLDRFHVRPVTGTVAFLNYEVSAHQLARWADDVGVDPERLLLVNLRGRRNPLAHEEDRAHLAELLKAHNAETLIVDPFGRAYTGQNQNDAGEVGSWLADLDRFARGDAAITDLILTAHAGWSGERTRGSSALEDWADSIVTLTRDPDDEDRRFLRATGRDIDVDEDELAFDPHTRHLSLTGAGSRKSARESRNVTELVDQVVAYVTANPGASKNKIEEAIKGRRDNIRQAIIQAVSTGAIWQDIHSGRIAHHPKLAQPRPTSPGETPTDLAPSPIGGEGEGAPNTQTQRGEGEPTCDTCHQPLLLANGRTTCERCRRATLNEARPA